MPKLGYIFTAGDITIRAAKCRVGPIQLRAFTKKIEQKVVAEELRRAFWSLANTSEEKQFIRA
jgi:hypothetical protein